MEKGRTAIWGAIVLNFVIALEILIMISPFAAFFYAAFNPFLLALAQNDATRWLTAFFLPHMISPSGFFLRAVRVSGSAMFIAGFGVFFVCAGQVYFNKFARRGVALRGLYSYIRHPQYLGLAIAGAGLAILWPRFMVVVLWAIMLVLYFVLAKDEERRMLRQHEVEYKRYMETTGRFLPKRVETLLRWLPVPQNRGVCFILGVLVVVGLAVGSAFWLRSVTVASLPTWSSRNVVAVSIVPDEVAMLDHRMGSILEIPQIKSRLNDSATYLVYFMHPQYIMQGMIADTGGQWRLYMQHKTLAMIGDWIIHPFSHLEGHHTGMHHPGMEEGMPGHLGQAASPFARRLIFLRVDGGTGQEPESLFGINAQRTPVFVADVDVHTAELLNVQDLPSDTGWGRVPTPIF